MDLLFEPGTQIESFVERIKLKFLKKNQKIFKKRFTKL